MCAYDQNLTEVTIKTCVQDIMQIIYDWIMICGSWIAEILNDIMPRNYELNEVQNVDCGIRSSFQNYK